MSALPALAPVALSADPRPITDTASAVAEHVQVTPADSPQAAEFRASQAETLAAAPATSARETRMATTSQTGGLLPDMAGHIDGLSGEMNEWLKASGPEGLALHAGQAGALDPAAQMQQLYSFVSKQFINNTMLSMKLNVTNQEMEAVNKDKDQLMRGGS